MYKIGDKIKIGPLVGEISEVYQKTKIGFNCTPEVYYDITLKKIPEDDIKPKPQEKTKGRWD